MEICPITGKPVEVVGKEKESLKKFIIIKKADYVVHGKSLMEIKPYLEEFLRK